jgi:hypothetical protein
MPHFLIPILLLALHIAAPFLLGEKKLAPSDLANATADVALLGGAGVMHQRKRKAKSAEALAKG